MTERLHRKISTWTAEGVLSREAADALVRWLTEADLVAYRDEIRALVEAGDTDELEDAFGLNIAFGTGGIRGRMGPGPNRLNVRTVGLAAQGLAQYVAGMDSEDYASGSGNGQEAESRGDHARRRAVVVAWDTRRNSEPFAKETARVLAANGIPVRIFDGCRSTPALSYAVRDLRATAGVMISASHNPPEDNGFKVYGSDGGQVVAPLDEEITREMQRSADIRRIDFDDAAGSGLIQAIGKNLDVRYLGVLTDLTLADARDVRVVYTPLHGVGMSSVAAALEKTGLQGRSLRG